MRHRVKTKQFNRDTQHRKALLVNLVRALVEQGHIVTTKEKAKEVKRHADVVIGKALNDSLHTRRILHQFFGKRDVVNTLVEKIAPAMKNRVSGFTTLKTVGKRRGDNSLMVKLELVEKPEGIGSLKKDGSKQPVVSSKKVEKKETVKKEETKAKKGKSVSQVSSDKGKTAKVTVQKAATKKVAKPTQNRVKGK